MKKVIQGSTITFNVTFYDVEPAQGGVPVDPDNWLHTWQTQHDFHNHVSKITLLQNNAFPTGTFYFSIVDLNGFEVLGYASEADRVAAVPGAELVKTGHLPYGVYDSFEFISVDSTYTGTISITFPESHLGSWTIQNDAKDRIVAPVTLLESGAWPSANQFWFRLIDTGVGYKGEVYDDNARTNKIADLAETPYGPAVDWPIAGGDYTGALNIAWAGFGDFHNWAKVSGDTSNYVTAFSLLKDDLWPLQDTFYMQIEDSGWGTQYVVYGYDNDVDRQAGTNQVFQTAPLDYGTAYADEPFMDVGGGLYSGAVSVDYPGVTHSWTLSGAGAARIANLAFLDGSTPPPLSQATFYVRIIDDGVSSFLVAFYASDADRIADTNRLAETASMTYGAFTTVVVVPVGSSTYNGILDVDFPGGTSEDFEITDSGWGGQKIPFDMFDSGFNGGTDEDFDIQNYGGTEYFEITDIGQTEPTYQIWNESNALAVDTTVFVRRIGVGAYECDYAVSASAAPGQNWHIVSRAKIDGADTFIREPFCVVDVDVALVEAAQLVTLSEIKDFLEIETTREDSNLLSLIGAASNVIETFIGTLYHVESKTEYLDGSGYETLRVLTGPIFSLTKIEHRTGTAWYELPLANCDAIDFAILRLDNGKFTEGRKNWRVSYQAGYESATPTVCKAVCLLVKHWYHTKSRTGVTSDVVGGGIRVNYQAITGDLPPEVTQIIKSLKRFR